MQVIVTVDLPEYFQCGKFISQFCHSIFIDLLQFPQKYFATSFAISKAN